ncbi:LysM peptidoglycan-binding domain-containing protein [Auraticoccus monumenti]|uniref:LysM domain-containing protein n=1 Tax=Auraticoccus monumenti TaxID=675864 RepID=A0A1G6US50_9ACTN|nr:LysM peptidoglycan-binding domain-containing protein [Auraticoccus monumenti]SDD44129.1 LysM domain-containing protein [Auraticoccus monumenti]
MKVLRGLGALVLLAGLLIGAPWLLAVGGRLPDPSALTPAALWRTLTSVDDGSLLLVALTVLGWAAWCVLVVSTLAELVALVARRPVRLPGLGLPQHLVRPLLVAVLALAVAPQAVGGAQAAPGSHLEQRLATPVEAPQSPVTAPIGQDVPEDALVHRVVPEDDLWSLAERYYGEGTSWRRIAEANPGLLTGGADHLEPGWRLVLPGARTGEAAPATDDSAGTGSVTVRAGDTLASLSAEHLGDAGRWSELHAANRATVLDPDQLEVGQVLRLPRSAADGPQVQAPEQGRPGDRAQGERGARPGDQPDGRTAEERSDRTEDGPQERTAERSEGPSADQGTGTRPGQEPGGRPGAEEPAADEPGSREQADGSGAEGDSAAGDTIPPGPAPSVTPAPAGPPEGPEVVPGDQELDRLARIGVVGSTGGLLAAAVVAGLAHRRTVQLAARPPGRGLVAPSPPTQRVRSALAQHQEPLTLEHLVAVQRLVARHCVEHAVPVPALDQVVVDEDRITITHRGTELPAPVGFDVRTELVPDPVGGWATPVTTWVLRRELWVQVRHGLDDDQGSVAWPALVSLGRQQGSSVLVCLQQLGLTTLEATDPDLGASALAALVLELGCSGWAGQVAVTLVGPAGRDVAAAADLATLATADDLEPVLGRLEHRWREQRALETLPALRRLDPDADTAWDPEVLLLSQRPTTDQWGRLERLVADGAPVAAVVLGDVGGAPVPTSRLLVGQDGAELRRRSGPALSFTPQLVEPGLRAAVVELLEVTGRTSTTPAPWWDPPPGPAGTDPRSDHRRADDATVVRLPTRGTGWKEALQVSSPPGPVPETGAGPTLLMLGPVELLGARGTAPARAVKQCMEYCAWLLENPGRTAVAMASSLLVAEGTRRSNMSRLRTWLGADEDDEPYLPDAYSGRILLHPAVGSDWDELRVLVAGGVATARTETLVTALRLVRGAPLADAAPHQWGWAEELRVEMLCTVRDIALVVTDRALADGDLDLARWAAARGLTVSPDDERLLVARLRTEHQAGNRAEVERLARRLTRSARVLGVDLDDETVTVLQQVMEGRIRAREA